MSDDGHKDFGEPFVAMAERIRKNAPEEFGGAVLIVGPGGEVVDVVLIGATSDPVFFWTTAKSKVLLECDEAIQEMTPNTGQFQRR